MSMCGTGWNGVQELTGLLGPELYFTVGVRVLFVAAIIYAARTFHLKPLVTQCIVYVHVHTNSNILSQRLQRPRTQTSTSPFHRYN